MRLRFLLAIPLCLYFPNSVQAQEASPAAAGAVAPADQPDVDPDALTGDPVAPLDPKVVQDKAQYNLFNPTPDDQMRQFSTDRPGKTHSALTVDAGHFQLESDFFNYTYDHYSPGGQTTRIDSVATPILKMGITQNIDVEAAFDLYNSTRVTTRGAAASSSSVASSANSSSLLQTTSASGSGGSTIGGEGFGDVQLGSKINLLGNEGGPDALALLPFIKIPTAARNVGNGEVEYTLNVPYNHQFDSLWELTVEEGFGWLKNTENASHHGDYTFLLNVARPILDKNLTASLEVAGEYADHDVPPRYTLDPALQYLVTPAFQLDVGIYIGMNKAAPDYNPYVGVSFRY